MVSRAAKKYERTSPALFHPKWDEWRDAHWYRIPIHNMKPKTTLLLPLLALLLVGGCATQSPEVIWKNAQFGPTPCQKPEHEHAAASWKTTNLLAVEFDLQKYRSVQLRPGQDSDLALAVAISGGGERAGNVGLGAMLQLERLSLHHTNNLLREVDYFSTVSGGGLPVAGYLSGLLSLQATGGMTGGFLYSNFLYGSCSPSRCRECAFNKQEYHGEGCRFESMRANYHWTLLGGLFHPRTLLTSYDRGDVLERKWDTRLLGVRWPGQDSFTLGDVFVPRLAAPWPRVPYWIANATVLENGAIFPFTPDVVERYAVSQFNHRMQSRALACPYDLPLAVGLKTSASFPAAIPATSLKLTNDVQPAYLQLSDGGLSDNLGVWTAMKMLRDDTNATRKVLIVIDAYTGHGLPMDGSVHSPTMGKVAARTMGISLDSWRGRYREVVETLCAQAGIEPVFLSFDHLDSHGAELEEGKCAGLINPLAARRQPLQTKVQGPRKRQGEWFKAQLIKIRAAARATPTSLSLSPEEQDVLVTAGKLIICLHQDDILQKLKKP